MNQDCTTNISDIIFRGSPSHYRRKGHGCLETMRGMAPLLLLPAMLLLATLRANATTDTLMVGGHCGICDPETNRLLVAVSDDAEAAAMPASVTRGGVTWNVATTTLPLVALDHGELDSSTFRDGKMMLIHGNGTVENFHTLLRYRGSSSLKYTKKNYAVKLVDANGLDIDCPLLGMRDDNSWILDAMASDVARMRNRVSTDLWLALSQRPYYADAEPEMRNGTHGEFVEVSVNGRYWGLYCMTEKVDRKQLKLKKLKNENTVRGVAYKAIAHDNLRTITEVPDNASGTWQGWEATYPEPSKDEPFTWEPLYSLAQLLSQPAGSEMVTNTLETRVDLPVWIDYCLLMDLFHADDNAAKNMIVYFRDITASDVRAGICPWDMDATWGRDWEACECGPETNCNISNGVNYHMYNTLADGLVRQCRRWAELRRESMTETMILDCFDRYFDLFDRSGAAQRETERWSGIDGIDLDFQYEREYLHGWVPQRLTYLDYDYGYSILQGIDTIEVPDGLPADAYGIDGRKLPTRGKGITIINGKKVLR